MAPPPVDANGSLLASRFEIVRRIGEGGMGVVYEALDRERGSIVALKSITQPDATAIFRFKREFRALADIVHPNLVPLYELISTGDQWFFTMQLVEGTDLARYLRPPSKVTTGEAIDVVATRTNLDDKTASDPAIDVETANHRAPPAVEQKPRPIAEFFEWSQVDWRRVRKTFAQLASAVRALHDANRLHRDLKPSNVLVRPDGTVVVLDFGLVAELERTDDLAPVDPVTAPQVIARFDTARANLSDEIVTGTIPYMAPEQVTGEPLTAACDWYAVGVMLYQVATGRLPHEGAPSKILANKVNTVPLAPRLLNASMPADLDTLCMALLQMQPSNRPPATAIIDGLRKAKSYEMVAVDPEERTRKPFIGRSALVDRLATRWRETLEGQPALCVLRGATGDGKSSLVEHFIRTRIDASRATVLRGRCFEHETVPFKTVDGVVDALVKHLLTLRPDELDASMPATVGSLSATFPVLARASAVIRAARHHPAPLDAEARSIEASHGFRTLLATLGETRPCLIVIDDAQWGDVDGMRMLSRLWDEPLARAMVIVVIRPDLEHDSAALLELARQREAHPSLRAEIIDVEPLGPDEARAVARSLIARAAIAPSEDELWIERIVDWSKGSPWLLELLIESYASLGLIARSQSLDVLLRARADALTERERAMLDAVCVAGHPVPVRIAFAATSGAQSAQDALGALGKAKLVRTSGPTLDAVVEPFHERVRDGLLRTMTHEAKAIAHERIALALEASGRHGDEHEHLARHWERAGLDGRAAEQWMLAAKALVRIGDRSQARHALERASALGSGATRLRARELLAETLLADGQLAAAYELARAEFSLPREWSNGAVAALVARLSMRARFDPPAAAEPEPTGLGLLAAVARGSLDIEPKMTAGVAATALLRSRATAQLLAYYGAALAQLDFVGVTHPDEWGRAALSVLDESAASAHRAEVLWLVAERCVAATASPRETAALLDRALSSAVMLDEREWIARCTDAVIEHALLHGASELTLASLVVRLSAVHSARSMHSASPWLQAARAIGQQASERGPGTPRLGSVVRALMALARDDDGAAARALAEDQLAQSARGTARDGTRRWITAVLEARSARAASMVEATATLTAAVTTAARMHSAASRCPSRFEASALVLDGEIALAFRQRHEAVERFERALTAAETHEHNAIVALCDRRLIALGARGGAARRWIEECDEAR